MLRTTDAKGRHYTAKLRLIVLRGLPGGKLRKPVSQGIIVLRGLLGGKPRKLVSQGIIVLTRITLVSLESPIS